MKISWTVADAQSAVKLMTRGALRTLLLKDGRIELCTVTAYLLTRPEVMPEEFRKTRHSNSIIDDLEATGG